MTDPFEPPQETPAPDPAPQAESPPIEPTSAAPEAAPEAPPPPAVAPKKICIRVFGVGGAGCNTVNSISQADLPDVAVYALNTDAQALETCSAPNKFVLGSKSARGLGAGGDPEVGRLAAEEDAETLRGFCAGADIVFILAGLGGGTGTGAAPALARVAREGGALVLAVTALPFEFEGARRQRQADLGLRRLKAEADAVLCLPNQKLFSLIDERTSVLEGFKISNNLLAEGLRGIWRLLTQPGLINVDFADLCSVTRGRHTVSSFAAAEAGGENRAEQAAARLFEHPLLEGGQLLTEADAVLVSIVGGPDLAMGEVNKIMQPVHRQCESAHVIFGAAIDERFAGRLAVTLIASCRGAQPDKAEPEHDGQAEETPGLQLLDAASPARPATRIVPPPQPVPEERRQQVLKSQTGRGRRKVSRLQKELPLEIVFKGRFEKSEPTIRHGEDLDVPTYIRRGVSLN